MRSESQEVTLPKEPPSVIADMAARFGMDKRAFEETLKATVVPANTSNAQFAAFLLVAKQYNLNPITKEIYAFPAKGGGIQPIVGIDGWCNIINSNPQLDGIVFHDVLHEGKLIAIQCKIYRKDRQHPTECTEYMDECKRGTEPWKQWPNRMLRHKALIQCARYAFGYSGIVDPDEAERLIDVTPTVTDPETGLDIKAKPSPFKTSAARREFYDRVKAGYKEAQTLKDLKAVKTLNSPMLDAMAISKSEYDILSLDGLEIEYKMAEAKFLLETDSVEGEICEELDRHLATI